MRGYGAGIDPITSGHFPFRNKLCMFIGDYDMFPVKIEVILDFKTDPVNMLPKNVGQYHLKISMLQVEP